MNVYLLSFNNYADRIVKRYNTLEEYQEALGDKISGVIYRNFNPNDGVSTSLTFNILELTFVPDYVLVVDSTEITSRWFVIEMVRKTNGQYTLILKRDVIADHMNTVLSSPTFIRKALLNTNDDSIFNGEGMTYNQILKSSELLKDACGVPWLVGYFSRDQVIDVDIDYDLDLTIDETVASESELSFADKLHTQYSTYNEIAIDTFYFAGDKNGNTTYKSILVNSFTEHGPAPLPPDYFGNFDGEGFLSYNEQNFDEYLKKVAAAGKETQNLIPISPFVRFDDGYNTYINRKLTKYLSSYVSSGTWFQIKKIVGENLNIDFTTNYQEYIGKVVKIGDQLYKVVYKTVESENAIDNFTRLDINLPTVETTMRAAFNNAVATMKKDWGPYDGGTATNFIPTQLSPNGSYFSGVRLLNTNLYTLELEPILENRFKGKLTTDANHAILADAPYDMFCLPFEDDVIIDTSSGRYKSSKNLAMATVAAIANKYSGAKTLYDVQLLPYCPNQSWIVGNKTLLIPPQSAISKTVDYYITDSEKATKIMPIFFCASSSQTFNISRQISVPVNSIDFKVANETKFCRLCSPNYASIFEFRPTVNRGVSFFNVDFTYKPYSPYIHINPDFHGLYGFDDNGPRGLICGGQFSLTTTADAFETYALQNKNYYEIFKSSINHQETINKMMAGREGWGALAGIFQGIGSGAATGALAGSFGGPIGALGGGLIGGAVGGVASALGGVGDMAFNKQMRDQEIAHAKNLYLLNKGNIEALPDTITNLSTFNINNKIFPVLEFYAATQMEETALRNKIKYNGMTVMRIGNISEFQKDDRTYIEGSIIRLEGLQEDYHIASEIIQEIEKGVFI